MTTQRDLNEMDDRDLDHLIAEHFFGYVWLQMSYFDRPRRLVPVEFTCQQDARHSAEPPSVPIYTADVNLAMALAKKWNGIESDHFVVVTTEGAQGFCVEVHTHTSECKVYNDNPARAICEAIALSLLSKSSTP